MQNNTLTTHIEFALRNYIREALADFDEESAKNISPEIEKAAHFESLFLLESPNEWQIETFNKTKNQFLNQ